MRFTTKSAPDATNAAPRSNAGIGAKSRCARHNGKATDSPSGDATTLATRPAKVMPDDSSAKSGAHGMVADNVVAKLTAKNRAGREAMRSQRSAMGRPSQINPAVAATESMNDKSKAHSGSSNANTNVDSPKLRTVSGLRPKARAPNATASMNAARQAELLPPAKSA